MAVIQDLPQEVLDRILELYAEDFIGQSPSACMKEFKTLSLVAKQWIDGGQRALWQNVECSEAWQWERLFTCVETRAQRTSRPLKIGRLYLSYPDSADLKEMFAVATTQIKMVILNHARRDFDWGVLGAAKIDGLSLWCDLPESYVQSIPTLNLSHLSIHEHWAPTWNLDARNALRRLLSTSTDTLKIFEPFYWQSLNRGIKSCQALLAESAPHVRTFITSRPPGAPVDGIEGMDDMILGFKQLTTLRIEEHYIPLFTTILRDASFRLVVLDFHHSTALATGRIAEQQLLEWVDLPALENLKRWRVHSRFKIKTPKGAGARWLAKCMERGIEVRDERRYFTD